MNADSEIKANLDRAHESLRAAKVLLDAGLPDDCASRCYYATFHAATAALLSIGQNFGKHGQVIGGIHRYFVKSGLLPVEHGKGLNWLFELRALGDYGEIRHVLSDESAYAIQIAGDIVSALTDLIHKSR